MTELPSHLQGRASRGLTQRGLSNMSMGALPNLSIKDNRFTLVDPVGGRIPIETLHIDVVIVDINEHVSKAYFGSNYIADDPSPPLCFSDNGKAPSVHASVPQATICDPSVCPHNKWGSKISALGSEVKACEDLQKIAVYVPAYSDGLYLMRIKGGSFKNWRAYLAQYQNAGIDPDRRITRIEFVGQGILQFTSPDYTTPEMEAVVAQMIAANAADMLVGRLDRPRTEALPKPESQYDPLPALPVAAPPPSLEAFTPPGSSTSPASAAEPAKRPRGRPRASSQPTATAQPVITAGPVTAAAPFRLDPPPATGIVSNVPPPPAGLDLDAYFKKG